MFSSIRVNLEQESVNGAPTNQPRRLLHPSPQVISEFEYPLSYIQAILDKTAGMPLYIEKMVEFLDQQGTVGEDGGGAFSGGGGYSSRGGGGMTGTGTGTGMMLNNISLQQVGVGRCSASVEGGGTRTSRPWVVLECGLFHDSYPIHPHFTSRSPRPHLPEIHTDPHPAPTSRIN